MKNTRREPEMEEFFSEDNMGVVSAMMGMITTQQNTALNLTKLILEHSVEGKITKEDLFDIYEEAFSLLKGQLEL